jgi:hypothetical protein
MQPSSLTCLMNAFALSLCLMSARVAMAENAPPVQAASLPDFSALPDLKPLVDHSHDAPLPNPPGFHDASYTNATQREKPKSSTSQKPFILSGRIESLENAIQIEHGEVDWYNWYLSARAYLSKLGGLDCLPGTPIKFYRNGIMEVQTPDMLCQNSVIGKCFPLPQMTHLDAIILPVRRGVIPPASRDELYNHIKKSER